MPEEPSHQYAIEPAPKMDARDLVVAVCTCGYRSNPTTEAEAHKRARRHLHAADPAPKDEL